MISPVTGGANVDNAGAWIFRLGNSDVLNGKLQAERFLGSSLKRIALVTEETEYTLDITRAFEQTFRSGGGEITYSTTFQPATTDFRSQLGLLLRSKPDAVFIPTQTGSALALILNQISQLGGFKSERHTTFTAADNPDAKALAKGKFNGLRYLAPAYDKENPRLQGFTAHYSAEFKRTPLIPFHTAATVDALDLLQAYLDEAKVYNREQFAIYLLSKVKNYQGLLGHFSIDEKGNANTGFVPAKVN